MQALAQIKAVRIAAVAAAAAAALAALAAGGVVALLFLSLPDYSGEYRVDGLEEPVDVIRDANGVPHIFARNMRDATLALGFVHAQDRLWQMESMRRLGRGRLAEIVGPKALPSDRLMRLYGFGDLVAKQYDSLDADTRTALETYTAGVNAWIGNGTLVPPPAFLALGMSPEPWHPTDSLIWGKVMAATLSGNWRDELLRTRMTRVLTDQQILQLWYPQEAFGGTEGGSANALGGASNAWLIGGGRTGTRKPILANDPHLGFQAPILWYLARLHTPAETVTGATAPGVPFVVLGHNHHVAWGLATTQADTEDLFVEQVTPDGAGYRVEVGAIEPFETTREHIAVKGAPEDVFLVRRTRHGPVVSDVTGTVEDVTGQGTVLALSATWLRDDDRTPDALHAMNRAESVPQLREALRRFHAPQQTVLYADTEGRFGLTAAGRVPVRSRGRGRLPVPGWDGAFDWRGVIPFDDLPSVEGVGDATIVIANDRGPFADYPRFLGDDWAPPYRAERIRELLARDRTQTLDTSARIQRDAFSRMATDLLPLMLDIDVPDDHARSVLTLLRQWSGEMASRRPEPLIFYAWLRELNRAIYADELGDTFPAFFGLRPTFIAAVLRSGSDWCDDVGTAKREDCKDALRTSLMRALDDLDAKHDASFVRWKWGDFHEARFDHPVLGRIPVLGRWWADRRVGADGGNHTVNRAAVRTGDNRAPLAAVHGAGYRAIYDLEDPSRSRFMIAMGQSGHPFSSFYDNFLMEWRNGRYVRLGLTRRDLESSATGTIRLLPGERRLSEIAFGEPMGTMPAPEEASTPADAAGRDLPAPDESGMPEVDDGGAAAESPQQAARKPSPAEEIGEPSDEIGKSPAEMPAGTGPEWYEEEDAPWYGVVVRHVYGFLRAWSDLLKDAVN